MPYQPRHARHLPAIFRGVADLMDRASTPGYQPRHSKREDT